MSIIRIDKNDIVIGEPSLWALYDQDHNVLVEQGSVVRNEEHLNSLLARGAYRELAWEAQRDENVNNSFAVDAGAGKKEDGARFTFNNMKLKVEDRLQLQPPDQLTRERFQVKVLGFWRGISLIVSTPLTAKGLRLQLLEGETVVMRSFTGQNAFAFVSTIMRICKTPCEYMHLSFPEIIHGVVIRKVPRVRVRLIAIVQNSNSDSSREHISALISDISANGVGLDTKQLLGRKGDVINLSFRVNLHKVDARLSVKGLIRAILTGDAADPSHPELIRHGIEFCDLKPNDQVILQSMIYQHMIENPQQMM